MSGVILGQLLVVQSLLENGEAYKAYDLVCIRGADIPYYVKVIFMISIEEFLGLQNNANMFYRQRVLTQLG